MKKETVKSGNKDFRLKLESGGTLKRQDTKLLPDGCYFFQAELNIKDDLCPTVVTCTAWLLEIFELREGGISLGDNDFYVADSSKRRVGIFYPPFSITRPRFQNTVAHLQGIAGSQLPPAKFARSSLIFETDFRCSTNGYAQVSNILNTAKNVRAVEANPKASLLSIRAKKLIDENYFAYPSIAKIAALLGVSHAHLTRQFKLDFDIPPNVYLRRLRVADVPLKLARGEKIINISHDVGYNDLSRFYKQFRQTTETSPGDCQTKMKPLSGKSFIS